MPLTFPAHQAFVVPLKMWRPSWFDGTALVVGAAAPDLSYPLGDWLSRQGHTAVGAVVWGMPASIVICWLIRWRAARGVFRQIPNVGGLRLRSYGVLSSRRPPIITTLLSAALGVASHVFIDGFTHERRWGARWLRLDERLIDLPLADEGVSVAQALQYLGHTLGSAVGAACLAVISGQRLLERWYGGAEVGAARTDRPSWPIRLSFSAVVVVVAAAVFATLQAVFGARAVFAGVDSLAIALLLAGVLFGGTGQRGSVQPQPDLSR
jgi:hypothetical protein